MSCLVKVKSRAGITGNECAETIAKYQASLKDNNLTDTGVHSAGPGGNPFYNIAWLAREEARPTTPELPSTIPNRICFPELKDALNSYMHDKTQAWICRSQNRLPHLLPSLLPHANKGTSNAFWNMPCI
eukprot:1141528-Pelagomonas_calceolata.AAC.2